MIAYQNETHYPVIFGRTDRRYTFTVTLSSADTLTGTILRNGRTIAPLGRSRRARLHRLTWTYGNAAAGTYQLQLRRGNGSVLTPKIAHNPTWY